jgi:hypothetical protein
VREVAAITGHKTLDMLKRYTHQSAEDLAKKLRYRRLSFICDIYEEPSFPFSSFVKVKGGTGQIFVLNCRDEITLQSQLGRVIMLAGPSRRFVSDE